MTSFNVSVNVDSDLIQEITEMVEDNIDASKILDEIDYDDVASNVCDSNVFYDSVTEIAREVASEAVSETYYDSIESNISNLLSSYDPHDSCQTGKYFTEAIKSAIVFLFHNDTKISDLIKPSSVTEDVVDTDQVVGNQDDEGNHTTKFGLFNEDLVGVYAIVEHLVENWEPNMVNDLLKVQMDMWVKFVTARTNYSNSLAKENND